MWESPWHWLVVGAVAFLIFGGKRLPELGKGLGEGMRSFKDAIKGEPNPPAQPQQTTTTQAQSSAPIEPK